jgi:hypothetical protein
MAAREKRDTPAQADEEGIEDEARIEDLEPREKEDEDVKGGTRSAREPEDPGDPGGGSI